MIYQDLANSIYSAIGTLVACHKKDQEHILPTWLSDGPFLLHWRLKALMLSLESLANRSVYRPLK